MIVTTTHAVEGKKVRSYRGIVFGEVIVGANFIKDFKAGLTNFFGGRSGAYEQELQQARDSALAEMKERAAAQGADAVLGMLVNYEVLGSNGQNMLMVTVCGTAVKLESL
ncbi:MAG: YbjQ family protein [Synergistaceae bacterium]|nr:YbjQ family protein [Synergistaceae bacterium]